MLTNRDKEVLDRKECRRSQLDVDELGTGKEAELCIVFKDTSITNAYYLMKCRL